VRAYSENMRERERCRYLVDVLGVPMEHIVIPARTATAADYSDDEGGTTFGSEPAAAGPAYTEGVGAHEQGNPWGDDVDASFPAHARKAAAQAQVEQELNDADWEAMFEAAEASPAPAPLTVTPAPAAAAAGDLAPSPSQAEAEAGERRVALQDSGDESEELVLHEEEEEEEAGAGADADEEGATQQQ
jgi:hypothetical protein